MTQEFRELSKEYRTRNQSRMEEIGAAISAHALALPEFLAAKTVFAFCSTPLEPATEQLLKGILAGGRNLCLPLCEAPGVMTARLVASLGELSEGAYGIMEPSSKAPVIPPENIDFVFVPCSAMDRTGGRIGKGGGYYDRFLESFRGSMAALCCEELLFDLLPQQPHDVKISIIITEKGVIRAFD